MRIDSLTLAKSVVMFGLGFWLLIAVINNITDMGTNLYFMKQMLTMQALKSNPLLGKGLLWHAMNMQFLPKFLMYLVIVIESIATVGLLLASRKLFKASYSKENILHRAISFSNFALIPFIGIWLWFFCGDLWFGFWITKGAFAMVHATWIMISLLAFIFINYQPTVAAS